MFARPALAVVAASWLAGRMPYAPRGTRIELAEPKAYFEVDGKMQPVAIHAVQSGNDGYAYMCSPPFTARFVPVM